MSTQAIQPRPEFGKLYGLTYHRDTKLAIVRPPRSLKVGIGIPKGRAISVFLYGGKWHIRHGVWDKTGGKEKLVMKTVYQGGATVDGVAMANTKEAAEAWHHANKAKAAVSNRPQKISWFYFTRRQVMEDASGKPIEVFEPDFDAIEAHGDCPRRIPVIMSSDRALYQEYAFYTASELKCHGDGILAERSVSMGSAKDEGWQAAKDAGAKMWTYQGGCFRTGCPHAGVDCKPHSTLSIQLASALRLGATAYFTSTGQVTADQLFSSLWEIREPIERRGYSIAGIPMDLVLGSFRANFEGKPTIQPCVSLELRASGAAALRQILDENSWTPMKLDAAPQQQIAAVPEDEDGVYDAPAEIHVSSIAAETDADFDDEAPAPPTPPAATQTRLKQDEIAARLKKQREATALLPFPWTSRIEMHSMLNAIKEKMGDAAFGDALHKHDLMLGTLDHMDRRALGFYNDLQGLPPAVAVGATAGATVTDDDALF